FQAEDGIRDPLVTGVQTCALPIFTERFTLGPAGSPTGSTGFSRTGIRILHGLFGPKFQTGGEAIRAFGTIKGGFVNFRLDNRPRSEERRVGKAVRSREEQ